MIRLGRVWLREEFNCFLAGAISLRLCAFLMYLSGVEIHDIYVFCLLVWLCFAGYIVMARLERSCEVRRTIVDRVSFYHAFPIPFGSSLDADV